MKDRQLVIGVTGGIAAYKTAELVSRLVQAGAGVSVVMTRSVSTQGPSPGKGAKLSLKLLRPPLASPVAGSEYWLV